MLHLWELIASGLVVGCLYGLIGMAFATIFKASRVVNFAQGEVMMLIAYLTYSITLKTGIGLGWQLGVALVGAVLVGLVIEHLLIRPMLGEPPFSIVMVTIGLAVLMRSLIMLFWDTDVHALPSGMPSQPVTVLGVNFYPAQLVALGVFAVAFVLMWAFLRYSLIGIAMRATANDSTVALLMGIPATRIYGVAWVIAAMLSGVTGVLFASIYNLGPEVASLGIRAFPATILGGLDSVLGSAIGGLIIGVVENLAGGYVGTMFKEVAGFVVIVVILMVKPYGLFGEEEIERV